MSARTEAARVSVLLADYAAADTGGKLNIVGGGWQMTGLQADSGQTGPMALVITVDLPPEHYGEEFIVEYALYDELDQLVQVPGPTGNPIPLRIGQTVVAETPASPPGQYLPEKSLWSRANFITNLPNGLALPAGKSYTWRVRIDGDESRMWATGFHVVGAKPGPVIG